jgi:hypothetical protein
MSTAGEQKIAALPAERSFAGLRAIRPEWALVALVVLYSIFMIAGLSYKHSYWGQGFDQVDYELAIWNTTQGRFLGVSRYNFTDTFMGLDVALGFLPAVPFYAIVPSAQTLIVLQSLLLASGAIPVYLIARRLLESKWAGVAWAAVYLLYPTTQFVNMTAPFQARIPGVLCILWAFLFFQRQQLRPTLLLLFVGMTSRTDAALVVVAFGLYALAMRRDWRWWAPPILIGGLYFYLAISVIAPAFYSPGYQARLTEAQVSQQQDYNECWPCGSAQIGYYSHLGESLPDIVINIITHPLQVIQLMFSPEKLWYLFLMFGTLLFLPLLAPRELLLAAPIFAINLLSTRVYQYVITEQYQTLLIPGMIIAGMSGSVVLWNWLQPRIPDEGQRRQIGAGLLLGMFLLVGFFNIPLRNPVVSAFRNPEVPERVAIMERMKARIPPDARVAATSFLGPHLIPREELYFIPGGEMHHQVDEAEYAFIDARAATLQGSGFVEALRADPSWELIDEERELLLFRKRAP